MTEAGVASRSHWQRYCALIGIGLVVISVVVANTRTFASGDMSVFTYALVASGLLLAGGALLLIALVGWLVAAVRGRSRHSRAVS